MARKRFADMNCGVAQSLEVLGDWWTLLIVRDAFFGSTRFSQFERSLGIAKNILTQRLQHLVDHEILVREEAGTTGKRSEYHLTEKGRDLLTVVTALREWSDRWVYGAGSEPIVVRDRRTGERVAPLRIRDADGKPLSGRDMLVEAGPGAEADTRRRFGSAGAKTVEKRTAEAEA